METLENYLTYLKRANNSQSGERGDSMTRIVKVQVEQIGLREQLQVLEKEHNVMVKTIGRERRQHDVEKQTLYAIPSP